MSIIYDEIKQGERGSREKFAAIDKAMRQAGCDCAILACTELSVFRTYHNLPPFYVDAMEVLAETAVTRCGYQLRTICPFFARTGVVEGLAPPEAGLHQTMGGRGKPLPYGCFPASFI